MSLLAALLVLFLPLLVAGVPAAGAEAEEPQGTPLQTAQVSAAEPEEGAAAAPATAAEAPEQETGNAPSEVSDPREWSDHSSYDIPPDAADRKSSMQAQDGGDGALTEAPPAEAPPEHAPQQQAGVGAINQSKVYQAIYQTQIGCRTHCTGTTLNQSAAQGSNTSQNATAIGPAGDTGGAGALNQSRTVQFIWQVQLGCVAFCWDTRMDQAASQNSQTNQTATAQGSGGTAAHNVAENVQNVWQYQEGCQTECYGASSSQTLSQQQSTNQSASSSGSGTTPPAGWNPDGPASFFAWVSTLAANAGATFQIVHQNQEADCLEHCGPSAQEQLADQQASTSQSATAGDVPEPVVSTPPVETPPAAVSPATAEPPSGALASAGDDAPRKRERLGASFSPDGRDTGRAELGSSGAPAASQPAGPSQAPGAASGLVAAQPSEQPAGGRRADDPVAGAVTEQPADPPSVALDTATGTGSDGPAAPWLPFALLAVAGLASVAALRTPRRLRA